MSIPHHNNKALCPICNKNGERNLSPVLLEAVADIDLGRWFSGTYAIPAVAEDKSTSDDDDNNLLP